MTPTRALRCLVAAVACVALVASGVHAQLSCDVSGTKTDCGVLGTTQAQCEARSCCWQPSTTNGVPWCFRGVTEVPQWTVGNMEKSETGFTALLALSNPGAGSYGPALSKLLLTATFETSTRAHFQIKDATAMRYEIPQSVLPFPESTNVTLDAADYEVEVAQDGESFTLSVTRKSDTVTVFSLVDLEYSNQFLQLGIQLPDAGSPNIYGLGEHVMHFKLPTDDHTFTIFNQDTPTPWDQNIYGSHPFYLQTLANSGNAHGVFLRNSNGMDVELTTEQLTFKTVGGILDFYVFIGPTPEQVVQQYQAVIGLPHLPPYWSLGWHQCKYGWKSLTEVKAVVAAYASNQIPLDTIWGDIDYMDAYMDFTFDPVNYPADEMAAFAEQLHADGQHYVVILDPGIRNQTGYTPYDDGITMDIFTKTGDGVTPYIGQVWPGYTAFPDFLHPEATSYWFNQIQGFLAKVPFDGLWIDMNEIVSFFDGQPFDADLPVNNPPYAINNANRHAPLNYKTLPMDALHYDNHTEYDVHSLFGLMEATATRVALEAIQQVRAFVLSRSTFAGSGAHTAHWLGDNHSTWDDLWRSIPGILSMNMFGVPMVGADICGFIGTTTEELCARWTALGSFYPFSRNHHQPNADQEPYLWASVEAVAKKTIGMKYSLLPSFYTQMYVAATQGGTVVRSLMFNFPSDSQALAIDSQFMWGNFLLVTPVLTQGATSVNGYFPTSAIWYDLWTNQLLTPSSNGWQNLSCTIDDAILLHVAGGSILFTQAPEMTTAATRLNPFEMVVAFDATGAAHGQLVWDDGESLDLSANMLSLNVVASRTQGTLTSQVSFQNGTIAVPVLSSVKFLGVTSKPTQVQINNNQTLPTTSWIFDATNNVLTVNDINQPLNEGTLVVDWTYTSDEEEETRLAVE